MSIRFLADADLNRAIVVGVRRAEPSIDFEGALEAGLKGLSNSEVLEIAAIENRVLVSHDTSTMPVAFVQRMRAGRSCPGVLLCSQDAPIGAVIGSLVTIWSVSRHDEWVDQIHYLPAFSRHAFR